MKKVRNLLAAALVLAMGTVQASAFAAPTVDLKDPIGLETNFASVIESGSYQWNGTLNVVTGLNKTDGMYYDVGPTVAKVDEEGNPVLDESGNAVTEVKNDTFDGVTKYLHIPGGSEQKGITIAMADGWYHYANQISAYPNISKGKIEFDIRIPKQFEFTNKSFEGSGNGFFQIDTEAIDENGTMSKKVLRTRGYYVNPDPANDKQYFYFQDYYSNMTANIISDNWYHMEYSVSIPDDKVEITYYRYTDSQGSKKYAGTTSFSINEASKKATPDFGTAQSVISGARILIHAGLSVDITNIKYSRDEFAIKTPEVTVTDTKVNASVKVANNAFLPNWYYWLNADLEPNVGYKVKSTQSPVFIFAQYGADGELLDVTYKSEDIQPTKNAKYPDSARPANAAAIAAPDYVTVSAEMDKKEGYDHTKVFVWDNAWKLIPYRGVFSTAAAE